MHSSFLSFFRIRRKFFAFFSFHFAFSTSCLGWRRNFSTFLHIFLTLLFRSFSDSLLHLFLAFSFRSFSYTLFLSFSYFLFRSFSDSVKPLYWQYGSMLTSALMHIMAVKWAMMCVSSFKGQFLCDDALPPPVSTSRLLRESKFIFMQSP